MKKTVIAIVASLIASWLHAAPAATAGKQDKVVVNATKKMQLAGTQLEDKLELDRTSGLCVFIADYVVPKDHELIIREGVKLVFNMKTGLIIRGKLSIFGTPDAPVIIKGNGSGLNAWTGIKFMRCDESTVSHAHISGALLAIDNEASVLKFDSTTFYRNTQVADSRERETNLTFSDCLMTENKRGVHYHFSKANFNGCTITDNKEYGVCGAYYGDITFNKCLITRNGFGIQDGGYEGTLVAHECAIFDNKKFEIKNDSSVPADCSRNWWGKKNTSVLLTKKGTMTSLPKVIGKSVNIADYMLEMPSDCGARDCPQKTIK